MIVVWQEAKRLVENLTFIMGYNVQFYFQEVQRIIKEQTFMSSIGSPKFYSE